MSQKRSVSLPLWLTDESMVRVDAHNDMMRRVAFAATAAWLNLPMLNSK